MKMTSDTGAALKQQQWKLMMMKYQLWMQIHKFSGDPGAYGTCTPSTFFNYIPEKQALLVMVMEVILFPLCPNIQEDWDLLMKFSWVFFLASKDETSGILQTFIRQIENQLSHRVKIIRSDNGTEFKNRDMLEFCGNKGIKQEYSNARTPQQNGVAERMNRTLIEAARTMLADSLLPTTFWAEAVSTACYIFNRVRVTKPQNKTPYELLFGHKPIISYIRPFGCHVTILDTLSVLGKFDGKSDEGFLVGYSLNSKAYRVYNLVTKRVEVNLHVNFLEDKPNVKGVGYRWMFDIDYLTDSMNYIPVSLENQANPHAGASEVTNSAGTSQTPKSIASEEKDEEVELIVVPSAVKIPEEKDESRTSSTNSKKEETLTEPQKEKKDSSTDSLEDNPKIQAFRRELEEIALKHLGTVPENNTTSTPSVNTGSQTVNTGRLDHDDSLMPELKIFHKPETGIFDEASYDEEGVITDFNSLPTEIEVSPTPTLRIHSIHPKSQILGDPKSAVQTRSKVQNKSGAHALLSHTQKQQRNNHKDQQHCLFACFLSQEEPKKIAEALQDDSWVQAMQEELLQFKLQQVWVLVDLPHGMKVIGTKWVYRNKRDERGVVVRNKARLVAQGYTQEEGSSTQEQVDRGRLIVGAHAHDRFSWVFFLATKDETSGILQNFIRQIENQLNHRVKIIRSDNGTEFKNRDMLEFCGNKGIKQEYSNARTLQQNGVAERMNRTLIEAARTMLADSLLPTTFWAEAVSTACYIFNRVRVTKPQNKTPYELLFGHKPIISYIRPFGCHVTILDTLSMLGKFDGKCDEGFLVGYSLNSKAFRVYNLVTKKVEVNLHVKFLEEKPNVKGVGYRWMFDIDYLTDSMNYILVSLDNQTNSHAGTLEVTNSAGTLQTPNANASEEEDEVEELIIVPTAVHHTTTTVGSRKSSTNLKEEKFLAELQNLKTQEKEVPKNKPTSTTSVNSGSEPVNSQHADQDDSAMPELTIFNKPQKGIFDEASYDDEGLVHDFNNLPIEVVVSPIPTLRIHNIHPQSQILGDPKSSIQTRSRVQQNSGVQALVKLVKKVKKMEDVLKRRHVVLPDSEDEDAEISSKQGRNLQEEGLDEMVKNMMKDKSEVTSRMSESVDKGKRYKRRKESKGKDIDTGFEDISTGFEEVNTGGLGVSTGSGPVSSARGQREGKAPMIEEETAKQVHLDALLAKRLAKEEELTEQQKKKKRSIKQTIDGIFISQDKYVADMLKKFDLASVKTAITPMETKMALTRGLDEKSTTGGCQFLGSRLISWQWKKQTIVATSTTEAEYVAAASCCGQVLWIQNQMLDYEIRHHFIRDSYGKKLMRVEKIHTDFNVAGLLTKAFDGPSLLLNPGKLIVSRLKSGRPILILIATALTLADGTLELRVTIDTLEYTITEASVRSKLQLADASGISMLPNTEIFKRMGNMGPKSGGWDQFSSNLATALICFSTGRIYNFSKLIFDGMVANLKSKSKFLMYPRFLQMILEIQTENKHPYLAIVLTKKIFGNMKRGFGGVPRPLLPAMLPVVVVDQNAGQADQAVDQPSPSEPLPSSSHPHVLSATTESEPTPVAEQITHPTSLTPEPDSEPIEHTFEQPSPEHQPLSPRQETKVPQSQDPTHPHVAEERTMTVDDLL
ncbi:putative ribonuclease H-like domain-containing protein [Tanacetum coccineum]|uniref:Ribonuclease H-like domain-containing protein n=1 Tax=Tanacetum coccineum TaxID=301880 RepID=A0ABQ5A446_9ASTR